jgi:DNA-binding CsgD family transcriptional regulator
MSTGITDATFLALVGKIYDAAYDPTRWPELLRAIARALDGRGTLIFQHNFETREGNMTREGTPLTVAVDFDPAFLKTYDEYYSRINVWAMNEPELKTARALTGSMLFPDRNLPKTEFYTDWLRPQDYFRVIGGVVIREGPWSTHFSSARGHGTDDFSPDQVRLYQDLLPHLARAIRIHVRFAYLQHLSDASLSVLDTVPAAVLLLDRFSGVLHGNATAAAELRRADPLRLTPSGELQIRDCPRSQAALRTAIAAALDPVRNVRERLSTVVQVSRRSGELLSIQALPVPHGNPTAPVTLLQGRAAACALVVHSAVPPIPIVGEQLLRHIYGLTPAEIQVALAVSAGETLTRYAERRRISRNTAASQLKSVMAKTGLRRQSELVRWLHVPGAVLRPGQRYSPLQK